MAASVPSWVPLVGITAVLGSFLIGGYAVREWRSVVDLLGHGDRTQGEVVDLVAHHDSDGTTWKPRVRFTTRAGRAVEFVSSVGSSPASFDVGEVVEIVYAPTDPAAAVINTPFQRSFSFFLVGLFAWIALYVGFWFLSVAGVIPLLPA
jgi:hypothetical protein